MAKREKGMGESQRAVIAVTHLIRSFQVVARAVVVMTGAHCIATASTPAFGAAEEEYFPHAYFEGKINPQFSERCDTLFARILGFFRQPPLYTYQSENLILRITIASGWGSLNDEFFGIEYDSDGFATITHIDFELTKCPGDNVNAYQSNWVTKSFAVSTDELSEVRDLIESDEFRSSKILLSGRGFDGADFLFEVLWPDGIYRAVVRWSGDISHVFSKLVGKSHELLQLPAASHPEAVKRRERSVDCP